VVSALRGRLGPGVELSDVGTSMLGLLDLLDGQELLVLVDACVGRGEPGDVVVVEPALDTLVAERVGTHQIGPVETLVVARELYPGRLPGRTVMVLVETAGLAAEAQAEARDRAAAAVIRTVRSWRGDEPRTGAAPAA
jgi:hydrogenase maturation protease